MIGNIKETKVRNTQSAGKNQKKKKRKTFREEYPVGLKKIITARKLS